MSAVDEALTLIALAYGYGRHFEPVADVYAAPAPYWTPTNRRTGDGDENNPAVTSGFAVARQTETLMQAGRAINPKDNRQAQLLAKSPPATVADAQAWSDANSLSPKGRGHKYRVMEFEHWKTSTASVVMVPRARPTARVLNALADAELDGPLEHLLMFAATQQERYWPKVRLHAVACGHPAWACDEAGLLLALGEWKTRRSWHAKRSGSPTRRQRDRALAMRMRASDYVEIVGDASARLEEWLDRASRSLLRAMSPESNVVQNFGEPSATLAETWWHPSRKSLAGIQTHDLTA